MFERLPEPDDRPFPGTAPVEVATFLLDFEEERGLRSTDGIAWQKRLEGRGLKTVRLSPAKQQTLSVNVLSIAQQRVLSERSGWQCVFPDQESNAGLYSTGINLERRNYPGFERFRDECLHLVDTASELLAPQVQTRLALQYSNALSDSRATTREFWRGKLESIFLGPASKESLSPDFNAGASSYTFSDDGCTVELRLAWQPDRVHKGCHAIVFQTEANINEIRDLTRDELEHSLDELHRILLKLFYAILTPEYVAELRAREIG